jgi:hypothetical protein
MSKGSKASAEKTDVAKSLSYNSAPWKVGIEVIVCHFQHLFTQALLFVFGNFLLSTMFFVYSTKLRNLRNTYL